MEIIKYIGYSLMIVAYTILLIENLNVIAGLFISISTIILVLIIMKYVSKYNKQNDHERNESIIQSVGNNAKAKGNLTFKDINQKVEIKSDRQGNK